MIDCAGLYRHLMCLIWVGAQEPGMARNRVPYAPSLNGQRNILITCKQENKQMSETVECTRKSQYDRIWR